MQKLKAIVGAAIVVVVVTLLTGCEKEPESTVAVGVEQDFKVGRLFTVDGCTAYRFYDNGLAIYYTNCNGATDSTYRNGKNVMHQQVTTDIK